MIRVVPHGTVLEAPIAEIVAATEAAYVAALRDPAAPAGYAATGPIVAIADPPTVLDAAAVDALALAGAFATAARFLAVGTPRSIGFVGGEADAELAAVVLAAHRVWFAPRDLRCAGFDAAPLGGRAVSVEEACACDIVCLLDPTARVEPAWIRRGTHVAAADAALDPELLAAAKLVGDDERIQALVPLPWGTLAEVAAGVKDGRELDEITVYLAAPPPRVRGAVARVAALAAHAAKVGHAVDLRPRAD